MVTCTETQLWISQPNWYLFYKYKKLLSQKQNLCVDKSSQTNIFTIGWVSLNILYCEHGVSFWLSPSRIHVQAHPWASCQIRKIAGAHAPGMPGTFSPSPQLNDPDMHHGTCVTHVPWCMPGSLTSGFLCNRRRGKTFPAFPAHAQPAILRIWQEAPWTAM